MSTNLQQHHDDAPHSQRRQSGPFLVEADSEIRKLFRDPDSSNVKKYMWLVGCESWPGLIWYELLTICIGGLRGALGIYLRQKFYKSLFRKCGKGLVIGSNVTIRHPRRIELGDNVVIDDHAVLDGKGEQTVTISMGHSAMLGRNSMLTCKGGTIEVGDDANISVNCTVISESSVSIGDKTLVGGHCYIIAGGNHGTDTSGVPFVDQPRMQKGGVDIRANCWLGAQVTVLDGTSIGPDAVVGAASLVNRDVPPRAIVGGVPAAVISSKSGVRRPRIAH